MPINSIIKFIKKNILIYLCFFLFIILALEASILIKNTGIKAQASKDYAQKIAQCSQHLKPDQTKEACLNQILSEVTKKEGISPALDLLYLISQTETQCHSYAHEIGRTAYELYKHHTAFSVNEKVTYCNYGFYHGFMQALTKENQNPQEITKFCNYISDQLQKEGLNITSECYHGIGHGTADQHTPSEWQDPIQSVASAMDICYSVIDSEKHLTDCAGGVFHATAMLYLDNSYGLTINQNDPYWLCKAQKANIQEPCFGLMSRTLLKLTDDDFAKAFIIAQKTVPIDKISVVISNLTVLYPYHSTGDGVSKMVPLCRTLPKTIQNDCLSGYVLGLLQAGTPGKEYESSLQVCHSSLLREDEKDSCFKAFVPKLKNYYSKEKLSTVCQQIDKSYQNQCL
jgi:hypothetical protein